MAGLGWYRYQYETALTLQKRRMHARYDITTRGISFQQSLLCLERLV
jgi:hypothetical protein